MIRIIIVFVLTISLLIMSFLFAPSLLGWLFEWTLILSFSGIQFIYPYIPDLRFHAQTTFSFKNDPIRVSISYLIKIKIKDLRGVNKYLIVPNNHFEGFQPVGGVYKYYDNNYLQGLNAKDDIHFHEKNDLRFKIRRRKLTEFITKFDNQLGREIGPQREFYEELIESDVLSTDDFPYIQCKFLFRERTKIRFSKQLKSDEIRYFDVYELVPTQEQLEELKELLSKDSPNYKWVSEDEIKGGEYKDEDSGKGKRILEQTDLLIKI